MWEQPKSIKPLGKPGDKKKKETRRIEGSPAGGTRGEKRGQRTDVSGKKKKDKEEISYTAGGGSLKSRRGRQKLNLVLNKRYTTLQLRKDLTKGRDPPSGSEKLGV